jgi:hypothetical protein
MRRGIATLGGSGLAVGNAEGEGDGDGELFFPPPKSPAWALGVVAATAVTQPTAINNRSANRFKRPIL